MADQPNNTGGQNDQPDVHHAPTQAWQGPGTPPPPPPPPAPGAPAAPSAPGGAQPGAGGASQPSSDPHYAPTQAWQGPAAPSGGTAAPPPAPAPPQMPGAQAGYGYPQGQPQPFTPQPGPYGPAPQPGPYGYPQQPNPYGQPGYSMPPGPGASGGSKTGVIVGIVAGVVAIALATGGIMLSVSGGEEDKPRTTDGTQLASGRFQFGADRDVIWSGHAPKAGISTSTDFLGHWTSGKQTVIGDRRSMIAYSLKDGKQLWTAQPPESGAAPCAMSKNVTADGLGAVLFRKNPGSTSGPCPLLAVIDTATGEVKWHKEIELPRDDGNDSSVAIDEKNKRVYAVTGNMAFSYDLAGGKMNWDAGGADACNLTGEASPNAIVVEQSCFDTDKTILVSLDLEDGHNKSLWKYDVPGTASTSVEVLSAEPAVVSVNPGSAAARGNIMMFDQNGSPRGKIPLSQPFGTLREARYDNRPLHLFKDTTMVTTVGSGSGRPPHTVVAFDLVTGKAKWHKKLTGSSRGVQAIAVEGETVLAAESSDYKNGGRLYRLALADGSVTNGGRLKHESALSMLDSNTVVVKGDLVLVFSNYVSEYTPRLTAYGPTG